MEGIDLEKAFSLAPSDLDHIGRGDTAIEADISNVHSTMATVESIIEKKEGVMVEIYNTSRKQYGEQSLVTASEMGDWKAVTALIKLEYKDQDERDGYGRTALNVAAKEGHLVIVQALLTSRVDHEDISLYYNAQSMMSLTRVELFFSICMEKI